jgi:uncharacterized repeat protein (TIGR01451 family)
MRIRGLLRTFAVLLVLPMLMAVAPVAAQYAPPPLTLPNIELSPGGVLWTVARQPDGGIVFGGYFTSVNGVERHHIARLLPNGQLDPDWNPSANALVKTLAVDSSGAVFAGGSFDVIGNRGRNRVAKLEGSGAGAADANWNAAVLTPNGGGVAALALDGNGVLYIGGDFTNIGGAARQYVAKVSASGTGGVDASWNPNSNYTVEALALDGAGSLYIGGNFFLVGGQSRERIAKVAAGGTGTVDPSWNPSADASVSALAVDGSGGVYAGGLFTTISGQSRNYIAKLAGSGTGAVDASWNPSANGKVNTLAVAGGAVFAGGAFTTIGGQTRGHIAKLTTGGSGAADAAWNPSADGNVHGLAPGGNGSLLAAGIFSGIGGAVRDSLAALPLDAQVWTLTYTAGPNGTIDGGTSQTVANHGSGTAVTAMPDPGHVFSQWSDGSTANPRTDTNVTANVNVTANFVANLPNLSLTISAGRTHVRYGQVLNYSVTLSNTGLVAANPGSIAMTLPPQLNAAAATWTCTNGGNGAQCTPAGSGALLDNNLVLPASRSLSWLVSVPVRADASGSDVVTTVSANAGTVTANASSSAILVLMRNGFETADPAAQPEGGEPSCASDVGPVPVDDASEPFALPVAASLFDTVLAARRPDGSGFRIERANLAGGAQLQLITFAADGFESAGAWTRIDAGALLTVASVDADADGSLPWLDGSDGVLRVFVPKSTDGDVSVWRAGRGQCR